jgi:amidase
MRAIFALSLTVALSSCATTPNLPPNAGAALLSASVEEKPLSELARAMAAGETSSVALTMAYIERIETIDRSGPRLNSVIAINPDALAQARALDAERRAGRVRGPLHGVPVLVKDNIETADPIPTTAGSLALAANVTGRDAPVVARLRAAGAVILGKTNLSEWANIRSDRSVSGWSAVGGLVKNPYALDRNACGSSSGSGAATAASLAAGALGTETDGSVICPSSTNGLVGLKPTVGLVSRTHVVPISHSQDTPGPMARSVRDAAMLLTAMAGSDPADPATAEADARKRDYAAGLSAEGLKGVRIGVLRDRLGGQPATRATFEAALEILKRGGAELVDIADSRSGLDGLGAAEGVVLHAELKTDMAAYLATTPPAVTSRTLAELIAFNTANAATEMPWFGQESFEKAQATRGLDDPAYRTALETSRRLARGKIDALLSANRVSILAAPSAGPAWLSDPVNGDHYAGPSASQLPAVSGYPHLTVPAGMIGGLPVGISFIGTAWSEEALLKAGFAFEQIARARAAPGYLPTVERGAAAFPVGRE